jgi:hypothetical protein
MVPFTMVCDDAFSKVVKRGAAIVGSASTALKFLSNTACIFRLDGESELSALLSDPLLAHDITKTFIRAKARKKGFFILQTTLKN